MGDEDVGQGGGEHGDQGGQGGQGGGEQGDQGGAEHPQEEEGGQ